MTRLCLLRREHPAPLRHLGRLIRWKIRASAWSSRDFSLIMCGPAETRALEKAVASAAPLAAETRKLNTRPRRRRDGAAALVFARARKPTTVTLSSARSCATSSKSTV